ncbi:hypothetical protein JW926_13660 [Candidatus Sumerlaeota bacterium]|nr:hypothetical protein [Candidatus Sumerlaeota bacterium]
MFKRIKRLLKKIFLVEETFLCDTCRYDYRDVCKRPERPNATECPDYIKR